MDCLTAMAARHSVRSFQEKPVPREVLEKIANAGRLAATARNEQPWEFVVVTDRARLQAIADETDYGKFIGGAAACIAVFCSHTKYYLEDGSAATQNMLVAAASLGVGSCWVAGDKKAYIPRVCAVLGAPPKYNLVSLIALGYPAGEVKAVPKRDLQKVIHWERF